MDGFSIDICEDSLHMRMASLNVVSIVVIALVIGFQAQHQWKISGKDGESVFVVHDFQAFYCAGATRDVSRNPYLAADYFDCGGRQAGHAPVRERLDTPAPIPGYNVALFAVLARIPYAYAAYLWLAISTIAVFAGAALLARAANLPPPFVAAMFALIAATALYWGQLTGVALGALCLAAYAAENGKMRLVGVAVIVAAIEPHIGLPALLAAAIYLPSTRMTVGAGLVVLLAASFAGASIEENIQYFTKVTPLQVRAEVPMVNQYSLTWLLHALGASASIATEAGSISYAVMIAIGVWLARPIARAIGSDAAIVLVPVACAVLGGPYIHDNQVVLALPAVLLMVGRIGGPEPLLWAAAASLAVRWWDPVWQTRSYTPIRLESVAIVAVVAYFATRRAAPKRAAAVAVGCGAAYLLITAFIIHVSSTPWDRPQSAEIYAQNLGSDVAFASGRYGVTLREYADQVLISWQLIVSKMPYWFALIAFVFWALKRRSSHTFSAVASRPESGCGPASAST